MDDAFLKVRSIRPDAILVVADPLLANLQPKIAEFLIQNRLPSIYTYREQVLAGGLISYATNYYELFRRAATVADKILKGAKPSNLPVEQPTKFELVINLKTAKALGLTVPPDVAPRRRGDRMRRREFITLLGGAVAAWPLAARAQKRSYRIGWLVFGGTTLGPIDQSLKDALAQAGLVDGRNIEIIFRYANGNSDRLRELAAELVAQKPDLLLAVGGDLIKALFEASKGSIPIVGGVSDSPIRAGAAVSLARPSKNFTGVTFLTDEMAAKRMELLKEVAPNARRVAVIFNPQHFDDEVTFARRGAETLGIELTTHPINSAADLDAALHAASAGGADSLFVISSRVTGLVAGKIAQHGQERRLPVIASWREFVASGALLSYGPSRIFEAKRLAGYVQKILNGAKPADLPIEQPVKFELVINLKTAKALSLNVPLPLLDRADELIE